MLLADHWNTKGITDDASHHILDADVRCGHEIAAAFGGDVLRADSAPSELESTLDRFNGSARLRRISFMEFVIASLPARWASTLVLPGSRVQTGFFAPHSDQE